MHEKEEKTAVVTVVGKDTFGIIARVSQILFENKVNIKDISQTIMEDIFTMIMIVDLSQASADIKDLSHQFEELGKKIGLSILIQHADLFNAMHRI